MPRGGYRPGAGRPPGTKSSKKKTAKKTHGKKPSIPSDILADAKAEKLDPLEYMLKVMNDPNADPARRDRMAVAAAPFVHPRVAEKGKKSEREDRAKKAGSGRFAPAAPPLRVMK